MQMDGGPKQSVVQREAMSAHRQHSAVLRVRRDSFAGRLFIWLYPNEWNSVFVIEDKKVGKIFRCPFPATASPNTQWPWARRGSSQDTLCLMSHWDPCHIPPAGRTTTHCAGGEGKSVLFKAHSAVFLKLSPVKLVWTQSKNTTSNISSDMFYSRLN